MRVQIRFVSVYIIIILAGCTNNSSIRPSISVTAEPESHVDIAQCEGELNALENIAPDKYKELSQRFAYMMRGASGYSKIRGDIYVGTKEAIDALYQFSTAKICAEIRSETLDSLSQQTGV